MSFIWFVFLVLITVVINVFITAFLIARNNQSNKLMKDLQENAQDVIRSVNRATDTHLKIAENTTRDLMALIEEARRCSRVLSRTVSSHESTITSPAGKRKKERSPKRTTKKKNATSSSALPDKVEFRALIKEGRTDGEIASHLEVTKAEVSLARFVLNERKKISR